MIPFDDAASSLSPFGPHHAWRVQYPTSLTLVSGPALEPISVAEAKAWLRVDTTQEDDLVASLITAARLVIEASTRRFLITQIWRLNLDRWPQHHYVPIPFAPFRALVAINTFDSTNTAHPIPPGSYQLDPTPDNARLVFVHMPPKPGRVLAGIQLDLELGYGDQPTSVPEPLRQAIRLLVARWFENRGDVELDTSGGRLPGPIEALVAPFRKMRLA